MKNIIIIFVLSFISFNLFSQGYIKVYTDLKEETSQFIVYLNEESQDAYPSDETEIEGLLPGKFKVEKMNKFSKDVNKLGRNMKKDAEDDGGLVQYYKLVQVREEDKKK